ncbi:MAG: tRNA uridine(34) 5-carboxymethylaminomethyl modification radical SAM/GNAT enzyme Elp3 [Patescibacteria group bacterium]
MERQTQIKQKNYEFDYTKYRSILIPLLQEIDKQDNLDSKKLVKILAKYPKDGNKVFSKYQLVVAYKALLKEEDQSIVHNSDLLQKIQMKPVRSISGVTPVTILTKPFPCPGKCIFCPNDVRMPKSYLSDEPGAQRAERNAFDPYLQTFDRLQALYNIGHNTDKIEIIILGGTWSFYPEKYQIWFIKRCFEAMNDFGDGVNMNFLELNAKISDQNHRSKTKNTEIIRNTSAKSYNSLITQQIKEKVKKIPNDIESASWQELFMEHRRNETASSRCVGLVIETRPDNISPEEVIRIRKLGCTKTQIGFQSLNDKVLELNHRGHNVKATEEAVKLLRWSGFKIHAHWMANLYGSNPDRDIADYQRMFTSPRFRPDELKVYPCSLIETAELMDYYNKGLWKPYEYTKLLRVVTEVIKSTPEYCRLTRVIRDIPGTDIVSGNKITNFRQIAEQELDKQKVVRKEIRSREVKNLKVSKEDLQLITLAYKNCIGTELFLQYVTESNKIAGFLRLALPNFTLPSNLDMTYITPKEFTNSAKVTKYEHPFIEELSNSAIIREIHIYGRAANLGEKTTDKTQHLGLGSKLIQVAKQISSDTGYLKMSVISAVGTRVYYRKKGFTDGELYQFMNLD